MCLGIPVQITVPGDFKAQCVGRQGEVLVDMSLVGPQPAGTWLLTFLDAAREVISPERALALDAALDAVEAAGAGGTDFDLFFADLVGREPELPDFLRKEPS